MSHVTPQKITIFSNSTRPADAVSSLEIKEASVHLLTCSATTRTYLFPRSVGWRRGRGSRYGYPCKVGGLTSLVFMGTRAPFTGPLRKEHRALCLYQWLHSRKQLLRRQSVLSHGADVFLIPRWPAVGGVYLLKDLMSDTIYCQHSLLPDPRRL